MSCLIQKGVTKKTKQQKSKFPFFFIWQAIHISYIVAFQQTSNSATIIAATITDLEKPKGISLYGL